jgi:hypothetical protein
MKTSLLLFFTLILAGPLIGQDDQDSSGNSQSQESLQNADFSDGSTRWHGDCKPLGSDMTTDFTSGAAGGAKGIVVDLHSSSWTKITQEIYKYKGNIMQGMILTIVYQTTPDFKFSTRATDYGNVGSALGFGGATLPGNMGQVLAFVDMPPFSRSSMTTSGNMNTITIYPDRVSCATFAPATVSQSKTFTAGLFPPPPTQDDKPTFCLAFPPGSGSITLLKISLMPGTMPGARPMLNRPGFPQRPPFPH